MTRIPPASNQTTLRFLMQLARQRAQRVRARYHAEAIRRRQEALLV